MDGADNLRLRPFGSSIAVGSSSTIHSGFIAMTPAIATLLLSAGQMVRGLLAVHRHPDCL